MGLTPLEIVIAVNVQIINNLQLVFDIKSLVFLQKTGFIVLIPAFNSIQGYKYIPLRGLTQIAFIDLKIR